MIELQDVHKALGGRMILKGMTLAELEEIASIGNPRLRNAILEKLGEEGASVPQRVYCELKR